MSKKQAEQQAAFAVNALVRGSLLCITTFSLQIHLCLHKLAALYHTGGRLYRTFVWFSQLFSRRPSPCSQAWATGAGGAEANPMVADPVFLHVFQRFLEL